MHRARRAKGEESAGEMDAGHRREVGDPPNDPVWTLWERHCESFPRRDPGIPAPLRALLAPGCPPRWHQSGHGAQPMPPTLSFPPIAPTHVLGCPFADVWGRTWFCLGSPCWPHAPEAAQCLHLCLQAGLTAGRIQCRQGMGLIFHFHQFHQIKGGVLPYLLRLVPLRQPHLCCWLQRGFRWLGKTPKGFED